MSGAALGALFDISSNATNPIAVAPSAPNWIAIAGAYVTHLQTVAAIDTTLLVANPAGGPITGVGAIKSMVASTLGTNLAVAATTGNPPATAAVTPTWIAIAQAFITNVQSATVILPGTLASPLGGGPVTGLGVITALLPNPLGDAMCTAASAGNASVFAQTQSTWRAMALNLTAHIMTSGQAGPGAGATQLVAAGVAVTGSGALL